jgi:N-acetylmuramoyl-L-alanine amidase
MRQKNLLIVSGIIVALLIFFSFSFDNKRVIVIDVGHGGSEKGVSIESLHEKDINLEIGKALLRLNNNSNIQLILTRENDRFISLDERIEKISSIKPDFVISIHTNYAQDKTLKGAELFYSELNPFAENAKKMTAVFETILNEAYSVNKSTTANFKVLKEVSCPSIMIETGFLSNDEDYIYLSTTKGQEKIAKLLLKGINQL